MSMECRLCLQAPGSLPLGDLAADLVYCCGLQVDADDGLPDHICSGCGHLLNQSTKFKRQCETSDRILRKRLGKNGNKFKYNETNLDHDHTNQDNDSDSNSNFVQIEIKEEPILFDQDMDTNVDTINTNNIKPETVLDDENLVNTDLSIKIEETSHHSKSEPSDVLKDDESMECRSILPTPASNHPALFVEIPTMSTSENIDYDTGNTPPNPCAISKGDVIKKRCRKSVTLETKLEVSRRIEAGEKIVQISKALGLAKSTVQTIRDNKEKIKVHLQSTAPLCVSKLTRHRSSIMESMEKLLAIWIEENYQRRIPMSQMNIQEKAKSIFENLKNDETCETFLASRGWFEKFKNRHNYNDIKMKYISS